MSEKGKIRAGVIGGAGYTGGETIRLLINHPDVDLVFVQSESNANNPIWSVHTDLFGDIDMSFTSDIIYDVDVVFLCMGHGKSSIFMDENKISPNTKVIDLGNDFRLEKDKKTTSREFVYGMVEANRDIIRKSDSIANPGCFATAITLALLPLVSIQSIQDDIHITATTGSTGAGQSLSPTSHFSWRASNLSTYKNFSHQHLGEIFESMNRLQNNFSYDINFVPYRGDFPRGIIATIYTKTDMSIEQLYQLYKEYYKDSFFTHISDSAIHLKQVVNTNKCIISLEKHGNKVLITSVIDNLLKGAAGQAVENMNLMFGLKEDAGLKLKPLAF